MNKRVVCAVVVCGVAVLCFAPDSVFSGEVGKSFGGEAINTHSGEISKFLFGPVAKTAGILGGAYGLFTSIISSTIKPLLTFGGIGLGVNLIPKFIEGVFTLLLP